MMAAVVPVKKLGDVKQRLAGFMSLDQRKMLFLTMLSDVLDSLIKAPSVGRIYLVTPDIAVGKLVPSYNKEVEIIYESGKPDLNRALHCAARHMDNMKVDKMLILPGDLPLIEPEDVEELIQLSRGSAVAIVPDKTGQGTNGLVLSPPGVIEPCFGNGSLQAHLQQAKTRGVSYSICPIPNLTWDMDYPRDILFLLKKGRNTRTCEVLYRWGYISRIS